MSVGQSRPAKANSQEPLTRREFDVLSLVAAGKRSREIAGQLGVSEATIKRHLYNIYRKLGVANRVAAGIWFVQHQRDASVGD